MPSADPRAKEIIKTIADFDESVSVAEAALVGRDWPAVDAALTTQHRLTYALANLLDETLNDRPQAFTDEVDRRIAVIVERRHDQMQRLIAFNHLVKQRLTVISRAREMRRVNSASRVPSHILDTLQ